MIYRSLDNIIGTDDDVHAENWNSRRLLLKKDGMGFSFHDTIIKAGTETFIWYANHLESVYCIEGQGEIETVDDGRVYELKPGVMYALNENDKHYLRANKGVNMRMMCVFNPPLTGRETHNEEGVYPLLD